MHAKNNSAAECKIQISTVRLGRLGYPHSPRTREKISAVLRGRPHPWQLGEGSPTRRPEVRAKISAAKMGVPRPDMAGENNPMKRPEVAAKSGATRRGVPHITILGECNPSKRPEVRERLIANNAMRYPENRAKVSAALVGKPHPWQRGLMNPNWNGGSSFYPYCPLFTKEYRNRIRRDYNNRCFVCGDSGEEVSRELSVHHVHYDKEAGCNGRGLECLPLCDNHHKRTYPKNVREWWVAYFENRLWNAFGWHIDIIYE